MQLSDNSVPQVKGEAPGLGCWKGVMLNSENRWT